MSSLQQADGSNEYIVRHFVILWTSNLTQKTKSWNDGFMTFHTFNRKCIVYDENNNSVAETFIVESKLSNWQDASNSTSFLKVSSVLVQIESETENSKTDITPVIAKKRVLVTPAGRNSSGSVNSVNINSNNNNHAHPSGNSSDRYSLPREVMRNSARPGQYLCNTRSTYSKQHSKHLLTSPAPILPFKPPFKTSETVHHQHRGIFANRGLVSANRGLVSTENVINTSMSLSKVAKQNVNSNTRLQTPIRSIPNYSTPNRSTTANKSATNRSIVNFSAPIGSTPKPTYNQSTPLGLTRKPSKTDQSKRLSSTFDDFDAIVNEHNDMDDNDEFDIDEVDKLMQRSLDSPELSKNSHSSKYNFSHSQPKLSLSSSSDSNNSPHYLQLSVIERKRLETAVCDQLFKDHDQRISAPHQLQKKKEKVSNHVTESDGSNSSTSNKANTSSKRNTASNSSNSDEASSSNTINKEHDPSSLFKSNPFSTNSGKLISNSHLLSSTNSRTNLASKSGLSSKSKSKSRSASPMPLPDKSKEKEKENLTDKGANPTFPFLFDSSFIAKKKSIPKLKPKTELSSSTSVPDSSSAATAKPQVNAKTVENNRDEEKENLDEEDSDGNEDDDKLIENISSQELTSNPSKTAAHENFSTNENTTKNHTNSSSHKAKEITSKNSEKLSSNDIKASKVSNNTGSGSGSILGFSFDGFVNFGTRKRGPPKDLPKDSIQVLPDERQKGKKEGEHNKKGTKNKEEGESNSLNDQQQKKKKKTKQNLEEVAEEMLDKDKTVADGEILEDGVFDEEKADIGELHKEMLERENDDDNRDDEKIFKSANSVDQKAEKDHTKTEKESVPSGSNSIPTKEVDAKEVVKKFDDSLDFEDSKLEGIGGLLDESLVHFFISNTTLKAHNRTENDNQLENPEKPDKLKECKKVENEAEILAKSDSYLEKTGQPKNKSLANLKQEDVLEIDAELRDIEFETGELEDEKQKNDDLGDVELDDSKLKALKLEDTELKDLEPEDVESKDPQLEDLELKKAASEVTSLEPSSSQDTSLQEAELEHYLDLSMEISHDIEHIEQLMSQRASQRQVLPLSLFASQKKKKRKLDKKFGVINEEEEKTDEVEENEQDDGKTDEEKEGKGKEGKSKANGKSDDTWDSFDEMDLTDKEEDGEGGKNAAENGDNNLGTENATKNSPIPTNARNNLQDRIVITETSKLIDSHSNLKPGKRETSSSEIETNSATIPTITTSPTTGLVPNELKNTAQSNEQLNSLNPVNSNNPPFQIRKRQLGRPKDSLPGLQNRVKHAFVSPLINNTDDNNTGNSGNATNNTNTTDTDTNALASGRVRRPLYRQGPPPADELTVATAQRSNSIKLYEEDNFSAPENATDTNFQYSSRSNSMTAEGEFSSNKKLPILPNSSGFVSAKQVYDTQNFEGTVGVDSDYKMDTKEAATKQQQQVRTANRGPSFEKGSHCSVAVSAPFVPPKIIPLSKRKLAETRDKKNAGTISNSSSGQNSGQASANERTVMLCEFGPWTPESLELLDWRPSNLSYAT